MKGRDFAIGALAALVLTVGVGAAPQPLVGHLAVLDCEVVDRATCRALGVAFDDQANAAAAIGGWLKTADATAKVRLRRAAHALGILGSREDGAKLRAAADRVKDSPAVQVELLAAAARLGDKAAADPLLKALDGDDERTRVVATVALGMLKDARATDKLIAILKVKQPARVLAATAQALGLIGDDKALATLLDLASRPVIYAPARIQALDALSALRARLALPLATQLVGHSEPAVGRAALRMLIAMPSPYALPAVAFALKTPGLRGEASRAAVAMKAKTLGESVLNAALDPELTTAERTWVLHALGIFEPTGAAPALLRRFAQADKAERIELLKALPEVGDRTIVPQLVPLLRIPDRQVANYVVYALENLTGKRFGGDEKAWREYTGLDKPTP